MEIIFHLFVIVYRGILAAVDVFSDHVLVGVSWFSYFILKAMLLIVAEFFDFVCALLADFLPDWVRLVLPGNTTKLVGASG